MKELTHALLITIICADNLEEKILEDLKKCGIRGYTIASVQGEGLHNKHFTDWEGRNIRLETIVSEKTGDVILKMLQERYIDKYSLIVYVSEVKTIRQERFK